MLDAYFGVIIKRNWDIVKNTNCLIENLNESESLPQIRNRYEKREDSLLERRLTGGRNEANDEGKEERVAILVARYQRANSSVK